jgi:flagellar motor protein MotB
MKRASLYAVSTVALFGLAACSNPATNSANNDFQKTGAGAALGAAAGAMVGMVAKSDGTAKEQQQAAIAGALIGAAGGAAIGNSLDKQAADLKNDLGNDRVTITNTGDRLIVTLPQDILFASDSATLRSDLTRDLQAVAGNLQAYPNSDTQTARARPPTTSACQKTAPMPWSAFSPVRACQAPACRPLVAARTNPSPAI